MEVLISDLNAIEGKGSNSPGGIIEGQISSFSLTSLKAMAPHSSTLAWKIPWMEETGRLRSMGSHRFGHSLSDLAVAAVVKEPSCQCRLETGSIPGSGRSPGRGQGNPL